MVKFSVIVPAYNEEKCLAKTLKSLKAQTYRDFELIVVDNNSKDNTNKIARKYADKVFLEKKKGYHNATNRGAKEAKGEFLAFCDADSIYPKDWVSKIMKNFNDDKKILAVYGTCNFYDYDPVTNFMSRPLYSFFLKCSRFFFGFDTTPGFNFAMRKKAYFKVGGYDEKIFTGIGMDLDLGKRLQSIGRLKLDTHISIFTSARRFRASGLFITTWNFIEAWWRVMKGKKQRISYEEYNKEFR